MRTLRRIFLSKFALRKRGLTNAAEETRPPLLFPNRPDNVPDLPREGTNSIVEFITSLPFRDSLYWLSHKDYAFDESGYDQQYGYNDETIEKLATSFLNFYQTLGLGPGGDVLEFGAGTGVFSLALYRTHLFKTLLITDPSPYFLKICQQKFILENPVDTDRYFVTLTGEDIRNVPSCSLDIVCLRYTLHHILDWKNFIIESFRILRKNGVLIFEEPFAEGYLLQAALIHFYQTMHHNPEKSPVHLDEQWYINYLKNSVDFYVRTSFDKHDKEDKHLFMSHEVMNVCQHIGFQYTFLPNIGLESFLHQPPQKDKFLDMFLHNCGVNLQFPSPMVDAMRETFRDVSAYIERINQERDCCFSRGLFVLQKT